MSCGAPFYVPWGDEVEEAPRRATWRGGQDGHSEVLETLRLFARVVKHIRGAWPLNAVSTSVDVSAHALRSGCRWTPRISASAATAHRGAQAAGFPRQMLGQTPRVQEQIQGSAGDNRNRVGNLRVEPTAWSGCVRIRTGCRRGHAQVVRPILLYALVVLNDDASPSS